MGGKLLPCHLIEVCLVGLLSVVILYPAQGVGLMTMSLSKVIVQKALTLSE